MKKIIVIISIVSVFAVFISCKGSRKKVKSMSTIENSTFENSVFFEGTQAKFYNERNITRKVKDISDYVNLPADSLIQLNDYQVQNWVNVFPNLGGYEYYLLAIDVNTSYNSIYVLTKGDGWDCVYLINIKKDASFIGALNVYSNHRSGPVEDEKDGLIIHYELINSFVDEQRIQRVKIQRVTESWESTEMYEKKVIDQYVINDDGEICALD